MTQEKRNIQIILDKLWIKYAKSYQHYNNLCWEMESNQFDRSDQRIIVKMQKEQLDLIEQKIKILSKQFKECN